MRPSTKQKQQRILEVASQLFFEQGFTQTSLDQVIERCGGSKQTLYRYFGDKQGLLNAVVGHSIEQFSMAFQFRSNSREPLSQQLIHFGIAYLGTILSPRVLDTYRIIMAESRHHPALAQFYLQQGPNSVIRHLVAFLEQQIAQGQLRCDDPAQASQHLLSLLKGEYHQEALLGIEIPDERMIRHSVEQAVACFLHGYQ